MLNIACLTGKETVGVTLVVSKTPVQKEMLSLLHHRTSLISHPKQACDTLLSFLGGDGSQLLCVTKEQASSILRPCHYNHALKVYIHSEAAEPAAVKSLSVVVSAGVAAFKCVCYFAYSRSTSKSSNLFAPVCCISERGACKR